MKQITFLIMLFICVTALNAQKSFTTTNTDDLLKSAVKVVVQDVTITYNKADVCGLTYLGSVKVVEKRFWYCNSPLKKSTKAELQKLAAEKGGEIVFVDVNQSRGFGLWFSTIYEGLVYSK